jgi:protein-disulfide isomerase
MTCPTSVRGALRTNGHTMRSLVSIALACGICYGPPLVRTAEAQGQDRADQLSAIRAQQEAIQKQLTELKGLLQTLLLQTLGGLPPSGLRHSIVERGQLSIGRSASEGEGADIAIIEFGDYECAFCRKHYRTTLNEIRRQYITTGRVIYVYKHFPLSGGNGPAFDAAKATECAGASGKSAEMRRALFLRDEPLSAAFLRARALAIGLEVKQFEECLAGDEANARVQADMSEAARWGIQSTPVFLIGKVGPGATVNISRRISGAQSFEAFGDAVESVTSEGR